MIIIIKRRIRGGLKRDMKRNYLYLGLIALLIFVLSACSAKESSAPEKSGGGSNTKQETQANSNEKHTIQYLGKDYTVPVKTDKIVITGSMETMEDALVLGVKPLGGITVGGKFPEMFKDITGSTVSIGEKAQPNIEEIFKIKTRRYFLNDKIPARCCAKTGENSNDDSDFSHLNRLGSQFACVGRSDWNTR